MAERKFPGSPRQLDRFKHDPTFRHDVVENILRQGWSKKRLKNLISSLDQLPEQAYPVILDSRETRYMLWEALRHETAKFELFPRADLDRFPEAPLGSGVKHLFLTYMYREFAWKEMLVEIRARRLVSATLEEAFAYCQVCGNGSTPVKDRIFVPRARTVDSRILVLGRTALGDVKLSLEGIPRVIPHGSFILTAHTDRSH
jgi:hypothetical protein